MQCSWYSSGVILPTPSNLCFSPSLQVGANTPSTGFCLLYRLFTMRLDEEQMNHLVTHRDSVYIRAIGFL